MMRTLVAAGLIVTVLLLAGCSSATSDVRPSTSPVAASNPSDELLGTWESVETTGAGVVAITFATDSRLTVEPRVDSGFVVSAGAEATVGAGGNVWTWGQPEPGALLLEQRTRGGGMSRSSYDVVRSGEVLTVTFVGDKSTSPDAHAVVTRSWLTGGPVGSSADFRRKE